MARQPSLFEGARLQMTEAIEMTVASLQAYGERHRHWAVAWSGGKDSTTLLTLLVWMLDSGRVARPESLTVLYADTRMELLPLWLAASDIRDELRERGIEVRVVMAPMDRRYFVYLLGRGVPPPQGDHFRWCTRMLKIEPMQEELGRLHGDRGGKILLLTGLRLGESAARDDRIALSCGRNGGECGQGWYQQTMPGALCDTLAPILWWRVCHVWEWLRHWAPRAEYGDWSTEIIADAYGGEEAEELDARTGCVGCPLASRDKALDAVLRSPRWAYLAPLRGLRPLYDELRLARHRLRKAGGETRADGSPVKNQQRLGPLTMDARRMALARILTIQDEVNVGAAAQRRPAVDLLNVKEVARIEELIAAGTWPEKWTGEEPTGDEEHDMILPGGAVQPLLWRRA